MIDIAGRLRRLAGHGELARAYNDCVHYDQDSGFAGTTYPYGTPGYPCNDEANAKTIADAINLGCIHVHGVFTVPATMEHYDFMGEGHVDVGDYLDFNSQDVDHCSFHRLILLGVQAGGAASTDLIHADGCLLYTATGLNGVLHECGMGGACGLIDGGYLYARNLTAPIVGAVTLTIQSPGACEIAGLKGTITLAGQDGGTVNIWADSAAITIDNTNTAGTVNIYGIAEVTDNNGGTTVNDYTINLAAIEAECTDAIEADDLDHLLMLDGATQKYPENCATDSILAKMLVKADPAVPNQFDNSTDSLEAIADALAAGTGCTAAIDADGLDHLVTTSDGNQAYPASVVDHSILSAIMTSDGDVSGYDRATDSLEAIKDNMALPRYCMDFWSDIDAVIAVDATAGDENLPDIVVADLPTCTVVRAIMMFKYSKRVDSSSGANMTDAAQVMSIDSAAGRDSVVTAINIPTDSFHTASDATEGGDIIVGDNDVAAEVTGNATYYATWELADVDGASLTFYDVQVGLRVWYTV